MKKCFYYLLMLFTTAALSLSFAACGEDDDPATTSGSGSSGGNNNGSTGGGVGNSQKPSTKQLTAMEYTDNEKGNLGDVVERYTGKYDSKGRVIQIVATQSNSSREYRIDYVWTEGGVENVQDGIRYVLSNDKVSVITWDGGYYNLSYNSEGRLYKVEGMDDGNPETYHLIWDNGRLATFIHSENYNGYPYQDEFTYEYSNRKGLGFFRTWHCEVMDSFTEDGLFIVHPELIGMDNLDDLPDRIVEKGQGNETEVTTFSYNVDGDGYVGRVLAEEYTASGLWKSQTMLSWR